MRSRRLSPFLFALLLLALPLFGETPPRNWGRCPAVVALQTSEVVHALGDTHGDYDRLVKLLVAGKLIAGEPALPQQVTWSGGKSILVVTGDMIDKWDQSLEVIALMRALVSSAASQGGRVVISAGNHEAEFLEDPKSEKPKERRKEREAAGSEPKEVASGTGAEGRAKGLIGRA